MRVAVITPYTNEPDGWIEQCCQSVRDQTHPADHLLIADGSPRPICRQFSTRHLELPTKSADYGHSPRRLACVAAVIWGYDAVAFLDADNWFDPDHIVSLVAAHKQTGADVCTSARKLNRLDGALLGYCLNSDGRMFCDMNCLFLTTTLLKTDWAVMSFPDWAAPICDRAIWSNIMERNLPTAHTGKPTICYRTKFHGHYDAAGEPLPDGIGAPVFNVEHALDRWRREKGVDLSFEISVSSAPP